jgi:hypothetical protein
MDLVRVFQGTEIESAIICSVLEENGIKAVVEGVYLAAMAPKLAGPAGNRSVCVCVRTDDVERARELIGEIRDGG